MQLGDDWKLRKFIILGAGYGNGTIYGSFRRKFRKTQKKYTLHGMSLTSYPAYEILNADWSSVLV